MNTPKPRVRLYVAGQAFYRLVSPEKGWRGPYGQTWCGAKWACVACWKIIPGSNIKPYVGTGFTGEWSEPCARNGHAPCAHCGKQLPRLNDGCPRAHQWNRCPAKTDAARMIAQHAQPGHVERVRP